MKGRRLILLVTLLMLIVGCQKKVTQQPELTPISLNESGQERASSQEKSEAELFQLPSDEAIQSEDVAPDWLQFQTIYFEFDQSELSAEARSILSGHAQLLRKYPGVKILIEGHCDERGTIEYNLALGARRAQVVKQYLANSGISETRLATLSYGKERPLDLGHDEGAWIKNRRAVFVIRQR
jgi:peptidoglycan-associated lipoprotein